MSESVEAIKTLAADVAERRKRLLQDHDALGEGIRELDQMRQRIIEEQARAETLLAEYERYPAQHRAAHPVPDVLAGYDRMDAAIWQRKERLRYQRDELDSLIEDNRGQVLRVSDLLARRQRLDAELRLGDEPFWAWLIADLLPPEQGSDWIGELRSQVAETPQQYRSAVIASHLRVAPQLLWHGWASGYRSELRELRAMATADLRGFLRVVLWVVAPSLVTVAIQVLVPLPWSAMAVFGWSASLITYAVFQSYRTFRGLKRQQQGPTRIPAHLSRMRRRLRTAEAVGVAVAVVVLSTSQAAATAAALALGYCSIRRNRAD